MDKRPDSWVMGALLQLQAKPFSCPDLPVLVCFVVLVEALWAGSRAEGGHYISY